MESCPQPCSLEKVPTGIEGFDDITGGGLPRNRTSIVIGGPGCGKTVFALQTLVNGARQFGEPGIFVAFEENSCQLIANAASFGWDLPALEQAARLFFLDARLSADTVQSGKFDLAGMLASLKAKAGEMGAKRIVFDSVDVLLTLLNDPIAERREIYRLRDWLSESGLTGIITVRLEGGVALISERYGFMQFMADCVVMLHHRLVDRVSLRELSVVKYRGSCFQENEFPLVIGPQGLNVTSFGLEETEAAVSSERVSSGVERLDTMLGGGYFRGAKVLITGMPGTAKSTFGGAFAEAACRRGEKTLYVTFDERASTLVRDLCSVGIRLGPHIESGILLMYSAHSMARSAEQHLTNIKEMISRHQPRCLVIDPLSAVVKVGGRVPGLGAAEQLLHLAEKKGITLVSTSLCEGADPLAEQSAARVSTIADTWIHLSYVINAGERNRALTIVKSRGSQHSNQVRELILSNAGVTLSDAYIAGGEVLMGTLRWEKERAAQLEREYVRAETESKRREIKLAEAEIHVRMEALKRELEARRAELDLLLARRKAEEEQLGATQRDVGAMRAADKDA